VVAYLDDILVYSKNKREHINHVKKVLAKLNSAHLWLNSPKCKFFKQSVNFLGFTIGTLGIRMDPEKISSVKSWPQLKNLKEVQAFLRFANYN
jgi:hypothetical protein